MTTKNPFLFSCSDLPRRAGEMREYELTYDDHEPIGVPLLMVPSDGAIYVDLRVEAVEQESLRPAQFQVRRLVNAPDALIQSPLISMRVFKSYFITRLTTARSQRRKRSMSKMRMSSWRWRVISSIWMGRSATR